MQAGALDIAPPCTNITGRNKKGRTVRRITTRSTVF